MLRKNIFSLTVCVLLMCAAALGVNRTLFGVSFTEKSDSAETTHESTDTISFTDNGTAVIHTAPLCNAVGYAGTVPLEIRVHEGRISAIEALPNRETPSFFRRSSAMFDHWIGLTPEEAATLQVDAVSGATYSSAAIAANMAAGLEYYLDLPQTSTAKTSLPWRMWIALAVTLAACVVPLMVRNRIYRRVQLVANVVVLGFWCGQFLDYSLMIRYLSDGISLPAGLVAVVMLTAAFIYPLFGRRQHYCNNICPLGSAQILVAEICRFKVRIGPRTLRWLDRARKVLWVVLMLSLWADVMTEWMDLE
ncbi:MAG: FMN-binding protein, partial [Muribaculaceae bacterium]|nr:FMN-binding protein [Muribaculaceae bacterium]